MTNDRLGGGSGGAKPPQPKFGGSGGQRPPAKNILEYFGIYLFWNLLGEAITRFFILSPAGTLWPTVMETLVDNILLPEFAAFSGHPFSISFQGISDQVESFFDPPAHSSNFR